jgi:hypothetical protein
VLSSSVTWRVRQTPTFERVKYGKVQHERRQTPASGDTNSREGLQVAGIRLVTAAPLDQESPGSSPGGAIEPGNDFGRAGLRGLTTLGPEGQAPSALDRYMA